MAEWANLQRRVNLLAVVDTSGSMNLPVPGTDLTRLGLLQQTAGGDGFVVGMRRNDQEPVGTG